MYCIQGKRANARQCACLQTMRDTTLAVRRDTCEKKLKIILKDFYHTLYSLKSHYAKSLKNRMHWMPLGLSIGYGYGYFLAYVWQTTCRMQQMKISSFILSHRLAPTRNGFLCIKIFLNTQINAFRCFFLPSSLFSILRSTTDCRAHKKMVCRPFGVSIDLYL